METVLDHQIIENRVNTATSILIHIHVFIPAHVRIAERERERKLFLLHRFPFQVSDPKANIIIIIHISSVESQTSE